VKRRLERTVKKTKEAELRDRCRIILLYHEGHGCQTIAEKVGRVPATVVRVANRFLAEGEDGLEDRRKENGIPKVDPDLLEALLVILGTSPQDYGYLRPTWTRELLAKVLEEKTRVLVSSRTVGRMLLRLHARWGRPKPTVLSPMPKAQKTRRLRKIEKLLEDLPRDEVAFYVDEVDIHLNPKIGPDWMLVGEQKEVLTPGVNKKRYIAGALNAKTGEIIYVTAKKKNTDLFLRLMAKLKKAYLKAKRIHLILDNYSIHSSSKVRIALGAFAKNFVLHFLPPYSPDHNRIEKLWKQLHDNVTRNHRCKRIQDLMLNVHRFLHLASPFPGSKPSTAKVSRGTYHRRKAS
jgi:transposase